VPKDKNIKGKSPAPVKKGEVKKAFGSVHQKDSATARNSESKTQFNNSKRPKETNSTGPKKKP